ncbi:hypothetical protein GGR50DRAFT_470316 [Xylaria sp. CBS 124048]|nr:hypothetical protein GGR50DRAFT_470316 [Xylaria sp. CBS 124048]
MSASPSLELLCSWTPAQQVATAAMASEDSRDLAYLQFLATKGLRDKESALDQFLLKFKELTTGQPVPLRVFQRLVDEHYEPTLVARQFLLDGLKDTGDENRIAKDVFDGLLRKITKLVTDATPHVDWGKRRKSSYDEDELREWLQNKYSKLNNTLIDSESPPIKTEVQAVQGSIAHAIMSTPTPWEFDQAEKNKKRQLSGSDDSSDSSGNVSPLKKQKTELAPGQWWGPNKSKLIGTDGFFEIIRQYKAYITNPTDEPGTLSHRKQMERFLKQALRELNMSSKYGDMLLEGKYQFSDASFKGVPTPSFVQPGAGEAIWRLGRAGSLGFNDFKAMLGGGLSDEEKLRENNPAAHALGMLALSTSLSQKRLSLRGGGYDDDDDDDDDADADDDSNSDSYDDGGDDSDESEEEKEKRERIRTDMDLPFRPPELLWDQLQEDVTFPTGDRGVSFDGYRPPMLNPEYAGRVVNDYRHTMMMAVDPDEWERVSKELDTHKLKSLAARYREVVAVSRQRIHDFIYDNPTHIIPTMPKLDEPGGTIVPTFRYFGLRDRDFARPMGYAVRARMYQLLILSIYWRRYLLGHCSLKEYLAEERVNLEIWIEQEQLYMEWENNRFFKLSSEKEKEELQKRYRDRSYVVHHEWEDEIACIDGLIKILERNPYFFDKPFRSGNASAKMGLLDSQPPGSQRTGADRPLRTSQGSSAGRSPRSHPDTPDVDENDNEKKPDTDQTDVDSTITRNATKMSLEILEKWLHVYSDKLAEIVRQNEDLDVYDPGNAAAINRNNLDIMAKKQVIWSLEAEADNLRQSLDPVAGASAARGTEYKWELPTDEDFTSLTRAIPKKKPLPLGITSLGPGPMPGEHPKTLDPRILVGVPKGFGRDPGPAIDDSVLAAPESPGPSANVKNEDSKSAPSKPPKEPKTGGNDAQPKESAPPVGKQSTPQPSAKRKASFDSPPESKRRDKPADPIDKEPENQTLAQRVERLLAARDGRPVEKSPFESTRPPARSAQAENQATNEPFLTQAKRDYEEVSVKYHDCKRQAEEIGERAATARRMAEEGSQKPALVKLAEDAERQKTKAYESYRDAAMNLRVVGEALKAQKDWGEPPETAEELRERYNVVSMDFDAWQEGYEWEDWGKSPEVTNDMWALEVTSMMHEFWKAIKINPGPPYWYEMYGNFWQTQGDTLEEKRKLWLHLLISDFNRSLKESNSSAEPFVETPPAPPLLSSAQKSPGKGVPKDQGTMPKPKSLLPHESHPENPPPAPPSRLMPKRQGEQQQQSAPSEKGQATQVLQDNRYQELQEEQRQEKQQLQEKQDKEMQALRDRQEKCAQDLEVRHGKRQKQLHDRGRVKEEEALQQQTAKQVQIIRDQFPPQIQALEQKHAKQLQELTERQEKELGLTMWHPKLQPQSPEQQSPGQTLQKSPEQQANMGQAYKGLWVDEEAERQELMASTFPKDADLRRSRDDMVKQDSLRAGRHKRNNAKQDRYKKELEKKEQTRRQQIQERRERAQRRREEDEERFQLQRKKKQQQAEEQQAESGTQKGAKSPKKPSQKPHPKPKARPPALDIAAAETRTDAWPEFKGLLQATWISILAHEALQRRELADGKLTGPAPVRKGIFYEL